jgi:hypothetical protein
MGFYEHAEEFDGLPVVQFSSETTLRPGEEGYRLWVGYDSGTDFDELFADFLASPGVDRVTALVIGAYSEEMYDESTASIVESLVAAAPQLPALTGLFLCDILLEENEVSWIVQSDLSPIWQAFPRLRTLHVRGSQHLSLGRVVHDRLRRLVIECGGLPKNVLHELAAAKLPELEHLELYLGTDSYGWDGTIEDVRPLLTAERFPKLRYLGLRDSEIADEVAAAVAVAPILQRIETLDLSLGTLGDEGAQALLDSPAVRRLGRLDVHHHYLSEAMVERLTALPLEVDASDRQTEEEYGRYVSVGE